MQIIFKISLEYLMVPIPIVNQILLTAIEVVHGASCRPLKNVIQIYIIR